MSPRAALAIIALPLLVLEAQARVPSGLNKNFEALPLSASVPQKKTPWADTNWPTPNGGMTWRWKAPAGKQIYGKYKTPSKSKIMKMSLAELDQLSPAEKYDVLIGNFEFPLVQAQTADFIGGESPWWAGKCEGWSAAALHYSEPAAVVVKGPSGIRVPFGSSDVKALLSFYMGDYELIALTGTDELEGEYEDQVAMSKKLWSDIGKVCENVGTKECDDVPADVFHLVLANRIGLKGEGFIIDVWNHHEIEPRNYFQPAFKYDSKILETKTSSTGKTLRLQTKVTTASDIGDVNAEVSKIVTLPQDEPRHVSDPARSKNVLQVTTYEYELTLDSKGEITSGRWISKERPDILMFRKAPTGFKGYFKHLELVYRPLN